VEHDTGKYLSPCNGKEGQGLDTKLIVNKLSTIIWAIIKMGTSLKDRIRRLLKVFLPNRAPVAEHRTPAGSGDHNTQDLSLRLRDIYGNEKLQQQLLYERWAIKDSWHLRTEALPLLLGMDPDKYQRNEYSQAEDTIKELGQHAVQCIEQGLLHVTNRAQKTDDWQVEPLDIYQWAVIGRLSVPDPLVSIMDFIGRTVKKSPRSIQHAESPDGVQISAVFDDEREKVLGMALAVLATYPDRCRNSGGEFKAELLTGACKEQLQAQGQQAGLSDGAMLDLIHKWLHAIP
jgi:hypothetical protein